MAEKVELKPHPKVSLANALAATLSAELEAVGQKLRARFVFNSPVPLLVLPSGNKRRDELWKNTCFELFFGRKDEAAYWELNVRPSGDWNLYAFDDYRVGMRPEARVQSISLAQFENENGVCVCEFVLDLAPLSIHGKLDIGITAVIEMQSGSKSYWAIRHAGAQPDFHLRESFVHTLTF